MKTAKRKNTNGKKIAIIICVIVVAIGLGVGAYFGARAIYDSGVADGRRLESDEISERVMMLGTAVSEKVNFQQAVSDVFKDSMAEVNNEGIEQYIGKLEELIDKIKVEPVQNTLKEYLEKWKALKETYASKDNNKIEESFNELKATAGDTAQKIKTLYDETIKKAIQDL